METIQLDDTITNKQMLTLAFTIFIDFSGYGIVLPLLPIFATSLGASAVEYGFIIAIFSAFQFLLAPLWGKLSDSIGRRPIILIGISGTIAGFVTFGFSSSLVLLYISRSISGIFTSATIGTAYAYTADISKPHEKVKNYGILGAALGMGFVFGPAIGGIFANISLLGMSGVILPALVASLLTLVNLVAAMKYLQEPKRSDHLISNEEQSTLSQLLSNHPSFIKLSGFLALSNLVFAIFVGVAGLYAVTVNPSIHELELGLLYSYTGLIMIVVQGGIVKRLSDKTSEQRLLLVGSILQVIGYLLLSTTQSLLSMYIALTPLMVGNSLFSPAISSAISNAVSDDMQGLAMGVSQSISSLMRIIGPIAAGILFSTSTNLPFLFNAFLFVLIAGLLMVKLVDADHYTTERYPLVAGD